MSYDVIFLQAKWSKIKERVEGWKSGKKMWFKRITVCCTIKQDILVCEDRTEFCGDLNETLMNFECLFRKFPKTHEATMENTALHGHISCEAKGNMW